MSHLDVEWPRGAGRLLSQLVAVTLLLETTPGMRVTFVAHDLDLVWQRWCDIHVDRLDATFEWDACAMTLANGSRIRFVGVAE